MWASKSRQFSIAWWLGLLALVFVAGAAHGQGFVFDEEEVLVFDEDEVVEFDEAEVAPGPSTAPATGARGPQRVSVVVVPRGGIGPEVGEMVAGLIQRELLTLDDIVQVVSNEDLLDEFEIMGAELALECAFDSVCMGRLGSRLGYDQVIVGRVEPSRGERAEEGEVWSITLNLVDTGQSAILSYRTFGADGTEEHVASRIPLEVRSLYGIRVERRGTGQRVSTGRWQRISAYSSLAGAAAALGVGIYFGVQAQSIEEDVRRLREVEGQSFYDATQRQAARDLERAQDAASMANLFFAVSGGLALVSTVFFLVTPGADIDVDGDMDVAQVGRPAASWSWSLGLGQAAMRVRF